MFGRRVVDARLEGGAFLCSKYLIKGRHTRRALISCCVGLSGTSLSVSMARESHAGSTQHTVRRPANYYTEALFGADEHEAITVKLADLWQSLQRLQFGSVFDAALSAAQVGEDVVAFVESGRLSKLYVSYRKFRPQRSGPLPPEFLRQMCAPIVDIYNAEWQQLTGKSTLFKHSLNKFSPEYVTEFNIESLYRAMDATTPCFVDLLRTVIPERPAAGTGSEMMEIETQIASAQHRHIVTVMSVLGNARTRNFNALQGHVGYYLFACRVPKRVISVLNKLGLCPSYNGLLEAIKGTAEQALANLRQVAVSNTAIQISYDNCSYSANKRDLRIFNYGGCVIATARYVLVPTECASSPMLSISDRNYNQITDIELADILPTRESAWVIANASRHMITTSLMGFTKAHGTSMCKLKSQFPVRRRLDTHATLNIMTLPTYPLNEGIINELIRVIHRVADDIGLSRKQREENLIMFKGDLATVFHNRYMPASASANRQSNPTPESPMQRRTSIKLRRDIGRSLSLGNPCSLSCVQHTLSRFRRSAIGQLMDQISQKGYPQVVEQKASFR